MRGKRSNIDPDSTVRTHTLWDVYAQCVDTHTRTLTRTHGSYAHADRTHTNTHSRTRVCRAHACVRACIRTTTGAAVCHLGYFIHTLQRPMYVCMTTDSHESQYCTARRRASWCPLATTRERVELTSASIARWWRCTTARAGQLRCDVHRWISRLQTCSTCHHRRRTTPPTSSARVAHWTGLRSKRRGQKSVLQPRATAEAERVVTTTTTMTTMTMMNLGSDAWCVVLLQRPTHT